MLALSRVLGLEGGKHQEIRGRALAVMRAAEDPEEGAGAFLDFAASGVSEVQARRHNPRQDGLTTIAHWRMGGARPMTELEIGQAMNSVLIAGQGTSISAIGAMFHEVLTRPVTLAGTTIAADDSVMLCWAAANRDPRVFDSPDQFRLDRPRLRSRHLSFGLGIHACPGQLVVRTEMRILLTEVLRRVRDVQQRVQSRPHVHTGPAPVGPRAFPTRPRPGQTRAAATSQPNHRAGQ